MASDGRQALGLDGEEAACRALTRAGCEILARRYRTRRGEIDIVARDGDTIVFVEVKTRSGTVFGDGAAAVTRLKQRRLVRVAQEYLLRSRATDRPCRFDVAVVTPGPEPRVEVIKHAFWCE